MGLIGLGLGWVGLGWFGLGLMGFRAGLIELGGKGLGLGLNLEPS